MITFRQKIFSEYDAMRSLYVELMKYSDKRMFGIIDSTQLLPILKGNNVVIERFVISTQFGRKDKYRLYLKIGAKAKMPEEVRLPGRSKSNRLFRSNLLVKTGGFFGQKENSDTQQPVLFRQKEFDKKGGNGGGKPDIESGLDFGSYEINYETTVPAGETLLYDKKGRSLVLEFDSILDAIRALDILPFGLNYNMYLLDV
jgi:hypothetical protein